MKLLSDIIKNANPKTLIGIGVAAAIGTAAGVKTVAKRRNKDLKQSNSIKKVKGIFDDAYETGGAVVEAIRDTSAMLVDNVREDIKTVVEAVKEEKEQACASKCADCDLKKTLKPCCSEGKSCQSSKTETTKVEPEVQTNPVVDSDETTLPEPVKTSDIVEASAEADKEVEEAKNEKLDSSVEDIATLVKSALKENPEDVVVGEVRDAEAAPALKKPVAKKTTAATEKKPAVRKKPATPRTPRASKTNVAPEQASENESKNTETDGK